MDKATETLRNALETVAHTVSNHESELHGAMLICRNGGEQGKECAESLKEILDALMTWKDASQEFLASIHGPVGAPAPRKSPQPTPTVDGEPGPVHYANGQLSTLCGIAFDNYPGPILPANHATQNVQAVTCPDCLTLLAAVGR